MRKLIFYSLLLFSSSTEISSQIIEAQGKLVYEDTLGFTPQNSWITINNPETNFWEIGEPSKDYFNSAHNGSRAILTDSALYYLNNCNNYFSITIPLSENIWGEGNISFYHKFDTDTLIDGGVVEMSYDKGTSWKNIIEDTNHISTQYIGLYEDTIKGGEYGFSGKSFGWQYVEFYWHWRAVTKKSATENLDTPIMRFKFISDQNNTNKEGWMIDDIVFRAFDVYGGISVNRNSKIEIFPTPCNEFINIDLKNNLSFGLTLSIYEISGRLIKNYQVLNDQINISDLKTGIYIYKVFQAKEIVISGKLIKN